MASDYDQLVSQQGKLLQRISRNNRELETNIKNIEQRPEAAKRISRALDENHELFLQAREQAKQLQNSFPSDRSKEGRAKLTKQQLTDELKQSLTDFEKLQKSSKVALQKSMAQARERHQIRRSSTIDEGGHVFSQEQRQVLIEEEQQRNSLDVDMEIVKEREQQLRRLEADMTDLNGMFVDLNQMIHDQGEKVDDIEANVEVAVEQVQDANKQLKEAKIFREQALKKKFCLFGVVGVAAGLVVLVIILLFKN